MTHQRSHATATSHLKAIASAPTSPNTVGQVWRERFAPKRYKGPYGSSKGGEDGIDGVMPTCPGRGPNGNPGGIARQLPADQILA